LKKLLPATTNAEILAELGTTEDDLLTAWRNSLGDARPARATAHPPTD
jgi:hypothetical protein